MHSLPVLLLLPLFSLGYEVDNINNYLDSDDSSEKINQLLTKLDGRMSKLEDDLVEQVKKHKDELDEQVKKYEDNLEKQVKKHEDDLEERYLKVEDMMKVMTLRSCSEYSDFGLTTTGLYFIDPDGPLIGQEPFQVLCNFATGSTEVLHNAGTLTKIDPCPDAGCYEKEVIYENGANHEPVPLSQIDALIQLSGYCNQGFYYECTLAPLTDGENDFAFWTDRHGEQNVYFTGANKGFHGCDCHFTDDGCFEQKRRSNRCNCDANLPIPQTDSGTITNMTALPVTKLSFGGLKYPNYQKGAFQLGNLRCYGKADTDVGSSCSSLKIQGVTKSGYYDIKKTGDQYTSLVYCDMAGDGYLDVPQTDQPDRSSPLGTITAWVSKPTGDASQVPIPDGWVLCDGSIIDKGPWAGARTPNLNSGDFLRGGGLGQQLETEEDQLQNHAHSDPGHHHSASSTASSHNHAFSDYYIKGGNGDYSHYCFNGQCSDHDGPTAHSSHTSSSSVTVSTKVGSATTGISGVKSSYRRGTETRPRNKKVSFIIKCW